MGSRNNCVEELQQQACAQRLELDDAHHWYVDSRREQSRLQEELSLKAKALRETQIRYIHEMGEMKRAQELQVDEFSEQKWRENQIKRKSWKIQRLTSKLQDVQWQMNSMNDSGEFQSVESNHSGRQSYVPSQPAMIPSSRSMLSRDKRLPFDTWNTSELQEKRFWMSMFDVWFTRNHHQGLHPCAPQRERGSVPQATGTFSAKVPSNLRIEYFKIWHSNSSYRARRY